LKVVPKTANLAVVWLSTWTLSTVNNPQRWATQVSRIQLCKGGHTPAWQVISFLFQWVLWFTRCLAQPCDKDGHYIPSTYPPSAYQPLDATPENAFHPFEDRLAFEFADHHFSRQQSSGPLIDRALQLWAAQSAKNGHDDVPWKSANDMYQTIDQIKQGDNPWKTIPFRYQGPLPEDPPKWMAEDFLLVTRDIRHLLHEQIACTDFDGHWDYVPYREFNSAGDRVWNNLMSGDWAAKQAVRVL
jgi:hypothetical protein